MARRNTDSVSLERTLSALEDLIVGGKLQDFGSKADVDAGASEVGRLVAKHLAPRAKPKKVRRELVGESLNARIAYLRRLLGNRTEFSPQLRAVFGSRRPLDAEETEAAIAELVRLGSRKRKGSPNPE